MYLNKIKIVWSMIAVISILTMTGCADGAPANTVSTKSETATVETAMVETAMVEPSRESGAGEDAAGQTDPSGTTPASAPLETPVDYSSAFADLKGCAVIYSPQDQTYAYTDQSMCETEMSPYSTFKIISALLGLEYGVIQEESSTMDYDGTQYPVSDWNKNVTFKEAMATSCIWYFHQVLEAVGQERVENALASLNYGNGDVSQWEGSGVNPLPDLNGFWQASSLKISPIEQVRVLADIFEGNSMFADKNVDIVKSVMLVDTSAAGDIYGKTGSGVDGQAWFVGFLEKDGQRRYIAVCLNDAAHEKEISGSTAREIALDILKS